MLRVLRYAWALPVSLLGLLVACLAGVSGGRVRLIDGVVEASGGWPARLLRCRLPFSGPVAAITLGHVVIGASARALDQTRTHERAHVGQFEKWGVLMLLLYPLAGAIAWLRGGSPYRDNPFEREARAAERAAGAGDAEA